MGWVVVEPSVAGRHRSRRGRLGCVMAAALGLAVGGVSAFAPRLVPVEVAPLAASAGVWCACGFVVALVLPTALSAAVAGGLALLGMVGGYVVTELARGAPVSMPLMVVCAVVSVVVGPWLGAGAWWVRWSRGLRAGAGLGVLAGVWVGEGVWALRAGVGSVMCWWGELVVAALVLMTVPIVWLRGHPARLVAMGCAMGVAVVWVWSARQVGVVVVP